MSEPPTTDVQACFDGRCTLSVSGTRSIPLDTTLLGYPEMSVTVASPTELRYRVDYGGGGYLSVTSKGDVPQLADVRDGCREALWQIATVDASATSPCRSSAAAHVHGNGAEHSNFAVFASTVSRSTSVGTPCATRWTPTRGASHVNCC
ncbi:hypothetical protein GCM10023318_48700 [Nocardia callitridis]|uniref:Uncharacterized protein n=1 Tax=Nocardia callitridis TaxID=648753 RepID=A0ABP9KR11_9NOCA